jgi:hypothetical protein
MPKRREPIDDLIDAHLWMRRQESRLNQSLPLDSVPDQLPAENRPPHKLQARRSQVGTGG